MSEYDRAFPNDGSWANNNPEGGMSLLDYFVSQIMAGRYARETLPDYDLEMAFGGRGGLKREEIIAFDAYRLADALMQRRQKVEAELSRVAVAKAQARS